MGGLEHSKVGDLTHLLRPWPGSAAEGDPLTWWGLMTPDLLRPWLGSLDEIDQLTCWGLNDPLTCWGPNDPFTCWCSNDPRTYRGSNDPLTCWGHEASSPGDQLTDVSECWAVLLCTQKYLIKAFATPQKKVYDNDNNKDFCKKFTRNTNALKIFEINLYYLLNQRSGP